MLYSENKIKKKNTQYTVQHVTAILPAMRQVFPRYMTCPITSRYRTATNEPIKSFNPSAQLIPASSYLNLFIQIHRQKVYIHLTVKFLLPSRFPSRLLVSALLLLDIPTSFCVMHSFPSHDLNHRSLVLGIYLFPSIQKFISVFFVLFYKPFSHFII